MKNWQKYRNLILEIKCLWQLIDKFVNKEEYKSLLRGFMNIVFRSLYNDLIRKVYRYIDYLDKSFNEVVGINNLKANPELHELFKPVRRKWMHGEWRNFRNKFFIHLEDTDENLSMKWKEVEETLNDLVALHDAIEKIKFDAGEVDSILCHNEVIGINAGFDSLVYRLKDAEKYRELEMLIAKRGKCTFTIDWNNGDWEIIEVQGGDC